jgi:RNA polymerase sigma-70 factor (ECF subfamily)
MSYEKDRVLVRRMLAGDQRACEAFFAAYAQRLAAFATARSNLPAASIEDVVQNSLFKAMRNLASFRAEAALFTWLCEICRHELANLYQKASRQPAHDSLDSEPFIRDEVLELRAPSEREPHNELEYDAHRRAIATTLRGLPERYARALEWKYSDGFSVDQIAQVLGLTTIAAQSLLARARCAFRECWRREQRQWVPESMTLPRRPGHAENP